MPHCYKLLFVNMYIYILGSGGMPPGGPHKPSGPKKRGGYSKMGGLDYSDTEGGEDYGIMELQADTDRKIQEKMENGGADYSAADKEKSSEVKSG